MKIFVPSAASGQGTAKLTATSSRPVTSLARVTVQRMRLGSAAGACEMPRAVGQLTSTAWAYAAGSVKLTWSMGEPSTVYLRR